MAERRPAPRVGRAIGPIGTTARAVVGVASIILAVVTGEFALYSVPLGLLGFPAVLLAVQWVRLRWNPHSLRATGQTATFLNFLVAVPFFIVTETRAATFLFYGASMLLAAARGYAGCEVLAISNWLLRRNDQVGCVVFSPIDVAEARAGRDAPQA